MNHHISTNNFHISAIRIIFKKKFFLHPGIESQNSVKIIQKRKGVKYFPAHAFDCTFKAQLIFLIYNNQEALPCLVKIFMIDSFCYNSIFFIECISNGQMIIGSSQRLADNWQIIDTIGTVQTANSLFRHMIAHIIYISNNLKIERFCFQILCRFSQPLLVIYVKSDCLFWADFQYECLSHSSQKFGQRIVFVFLWNVLSKIQQLLILLQHEQFGQPTACIMFFNQSLLAHILFQSTGLVFQQACIVAIHQMLQEQ